MSTTIATRRYLSDEQVASYHRDGYLAVSRLIDAEKVAALRRTTQAFVERSRGVSRSDDVFDLDPRHTPAAPAVRRIKNPADNDPLYAWVGMESPIVDIVTELIGPSVRFHHSKLNLLAPDSTASPLWGRLLRGTWPAVARRTAGDMPMPPDFSRGYTSIYALQSATAAQETSAKM